MGYRKMNGDSAFSSPSKDVISYSDIQMSPNFEISPDSLASRSSKTPTIVPEIYSPEIVRNSRAMTSSGAFPSFSASSIALFDEESLEYDVDHVAELLARARGSDAHDAAVSLFGLGKGKRDYMPINDVPPSFNLVSAVTSPSNRVCIDVNYQTKYHADIASQLIPDETPRIANGIHQSAQCEVPNFSVVVSPISKQEDHTFSIEGSFDSVRKNTVLDLDFKPESEWVAFDPFEEITEHTRVSFTEYVPDDENERSSRSASHKVSHQLEELNGRLATVERILRTIEYNGTQTLSRAFIVDDIESMSDDRTYTPVEKNRYSSNTKPRLFDRFIRGNKSQLIEI